MTVLGNNKEKSSSIYMGFEIDGWIYKRHNDRKKRYEINANKNICGVYPSHGF